MGLIIPSLRGVFPHGKNGSIRSIKVKIEIIETPDNIRVYIDDSFYKDYKPDELNHNEFVELMYGMDISAGLSWSWEVRK